jgi:hypothetical protein
MQANIQEIYSASIRPLSDAEKLQIATLILEEVTGKAPVNGAGRAHKREGDTTQFFGMWKGGAADDSDNEKIDADLARAYANEDGDEA